MSAKWILSGIAGVGGTVLIAIYFVLGGFEPFEDPVRVILPHEFGGVFCVRLTSGGSASAHDQGNGFVASEGGVLELTLDLVQSHRRKRFFRKSAEQELLAELSPDEWFAILTERDAVRGTEYAVYWIGTRPGWERFDAARRGRGLCVDREETVNVAVRLR